METKTIDMLFLELSQVTQATTAKELSLIERIRELELAIMPFAKLVATTNGRIPTERLSLADWQALMKACRSNVRANRPAAPADGPG
jgi:hypothetical protein